MFFLSYRKLNGPLFIYDCFLLLCLRVKNMNRKFLFVLGLSLVLSSISTPAGASGIFSDLTSKGAEIFMGVRDIVYVVSGFGIIGIAIGGFFGNLNWKWLGAIIIGLMVVGMTASILEYVAGSGVSLGGITDTLK